MFNLRAAAASAVTFVVLLLITTKLAEQGYDEMIPEMEKRQQQEQQRQQEFSSLVKQDMAVMGGDYQTQVGQQEYASNSGISEIGMPSRQLRPLEPWMGVREGSGKSISFMKFEKKNYWLWIKNAGGEDIREKGKYEYLYDSIEFKPDGRSSYTLEYYMVSKNAIALSGYDYSYNLEREEDLKFDF
jgi:hypothetical protein